ncbi:type I-C CRISPR-associated protein Cas8c/Csd1 [Actinosynnema sp. NPDC023587]|uniref:type I-C CRISPR-associated protein Cas8c/Csd1 n=1 Tax=Actinosynnema sp. NPDC023587 TaxID=3154695 RepID=UPI0033C00A44
MLVRRLVDVAERNRSAAPFHRALRFDWELRLGLDGTVHSDGLEALVDPDSPPKKPRGVEHVVPAVVRTVGVAPNLAADDIQYVLGWADPEGKPERVAKCHDAFVDLTRRWAASDEGRADPVPTALARFYESGQAEWLHRHPDATMKQRVLITVDGHAAYRAPSVAAFWAAEVALRKGDGRVGLCLVCGKHRPLLDTLPGKVPARLVPGASNDAALVSINERVFGYDLSTQLSCSPICITCGEALSAGLVQVLESPDTASYGGQDSRLAWWVTQPVERNAMRRIVDADPAKTRELIRAVRKGRKPDASADKTKFCALTVGGNVARVMVRDWLEMPLNTLEDNVVRWFEDMEVPPLRPDEPPYLSLGRLVRVTGRWHRQRKEYVPIGTKGADRPDDIQRHLLRAAMRGTRLPPSLLLHVLHRVRADGRLDTPRAALLSLTLRRSPSTTESPMTGLNPESTDPAYVAGRIFAALDALQYDALQGKINASFANKHFQGAPANPRTALLAGSRHVDAWLRKFRGDRKGIGVNHSRELDSLYKLLTAPVSEKDPHEVIPARATPRQQATFLLGYHHQRAHRFDTLRTKAEARAAAQSDDPTTNQEDSE